MESFAHVLQWGAIGVGSLVVIIEGLKLRSTDAKQQGMLINHDFLIKAFWDLAGRKALVGALKGIVEMNSPLVITETARPKYDKVTQRLLDWYFSDGKNLDRNPESIDMEEVRDFYIQVSHKFGADLMAEVCIPYQIDPEESIWGAIAIMREAWAERNAKTDSDKGQETEHGL